MLVFTLVFVVVSTLFIPYFTNVRFRRLQDGSDEQKVDSIQEEKVVLVSLWLS